MFRFLSKKKLCFSIDTDPPTPPPLSCWLRLNAACTPVALVCAPPLQPRKRAREEAPGPAGDDAGEPSGVSGLASGFLNRGFLSAAGRVSGGSAFGARNRSESRGRMVWSGSSSGRHAGAVLVLLNLRVVALRAICVWRSCLRAAAATAALVMCPPEALLTCARIGGQSGESSSSQRPHPPLQMVSGAALIPESEVSRRPGLHVARSVYLPKGWVMAILLGTSVCQTERRLPRVLTAPAFHCLCVCQAARRTPQGGDQGTSAPGTIQRPGKYPNQWLIRCNFGALWALCHTA